MRVAAADFLRHVRVEERGYSACSRVCACYVRARALDRVICDVSGPIGCHLSSRCRRDPPLTPAISFPPSRPRLCRSLPPPLSSSRSPLALLPTISVATLPPMQPANAIRSAPLLSPSCDHPRAMSPLGLTCAIVPLPPPLPYFHFPPRPCPRRDFLPSSAATLARFPPHCASFHPRPSLGFHLALFSGYANGVISALFFAVNLRSLVRVTTHSTSRPFVVATERRFSAEGN